VSSISARATIVSRKRLVPRAGVALEERIEPGDVLTCEVPVEDVVGQREVALRAAASMPVTRGGRRVPFLATTLVGPVSSVDIVPATEESTKQLDLLLR
jgi:hypothetical protein